MRNKKKLNDIGKKVSYLLRHKEGYLDEKGYTSVDDLLYDTSLTKEELDWIVENNNKKRFAYNEDETKLRASQGHTHEVDVDLSLIVPPNLLYHGTALKNFESIKENGLIRGERQHVHLSADKETAKNVGNRHVKSGDYLLLLVIDADLMHNNGHKIFLSENGVYLTNHVPIDYIKIIP